ncbi:MAG: hypothetical protein ACI9N9_001970 [Enterobacterales bacterium]|jgi:hypothetical protein
MTGRKNSTLPWRRTMLESVAIILSILLAFAIDAGWDKFKEGKQEKAFLESILSDFKETRSRIEESNTAHMKFIESSQQLLSFHGVDTPNIETEALEKILGSVFYDFNSLYLPSGSRDALFASGDIEIISNEKLRSMLAAWPTIVADASEDDALIAYDVMNAMAPYLNRKIRTRNVIRSTDSPTAAELIPSIESVNYEVLWMDPEFDNIVSFRILNETYAIMENGNLSKAANEIIQVIEKELAR